MRSWAQGLGTLQYFTWQTNKTTHGFVKVHEFRTLVTEGGGIWFLADTRGKCWGLMSESKREGGVGVVHGDSSILCLTPHLSHGIWFVFKQWSQWQVHSLYPGSNQHQVGGSQAGLCSLSAAQSPTQASMTNRLGFPCHNIPLPKPRLTPRLSPFLLSHSPTPRPPPLSCPILPCLHLSRGLQ